MRPWVAVEISCGAVFKIEAALVTVPSEPDPTTDDGPSAAKFETKKAADIEAPAAAEAPIVVPGGASKGSQAA